MSPAPTSVEIVFLTFAALSVCSGLLLIALFWKVRELRKGPGQLILAQCIAQIVLDIHWLTYFSFVPHEGTTCQALGCLSFFAYVVAFNYAVAVCWVLLKRFYEPFLEPTYLFRIHCLCVLVGLAIAVPVGAKQLTGHSVIHTCYVKSYTSAERPLTLFILIIWTAISLYLAVTSWIQYRKSDRFSLNAVAVVLVFSIAWLGAGTVHFDMWEVINKHHDTLPSSFRSVILTQFAMISASMSGLLTVLTRFGHAPIRDGIKSLFRKPRSISFEDLTAGFE